MSYNCNPKPYNANDVTSWGYFRPTIIAHDVGRSRDRSTAVIGGKSPAPPQLIGIGELYELPRGLYGSPRAYELAQIDNRYDNNTLIVADLSNDPTYAEPLHKLFGPRLIGLQITRHGDGMEPVRRPVNGSAILIYTIGRSILFEQLHSLLETGEVRFPNTETMRRAFAHFMRWRQNCATAAPPTSVRMGNMTISPSPAPCWFGRLTTTTWSIGYALCKRAAGRPLAYQRSDPARGANNRALLLAQSF